MNRTSILIGLATAAVAFSIAIFAQPGTALTPPADAFPLFALLTLLEALAFGAGVAYVLRARRVLFAEGTAPLERAVAWCVAFLLLAPWPHDSLHRLAMLDVPGGIYINWRFLAAIEFVFHLGIVPVALVFGAYLLRTTRLPHA